MVFTPVWMPLHVLGDILATSLGRSFGDAGYELRALGDGASGVVCDNAVRDLDGSAHADQCRECIGPLLNKVSQELRDYETQHIRLMGPQCLFVDDRYLWFLLASAGIFATVSYIVVLRTREVGIRMALGAKKRDILALVMRESTQPVLAVLRLQLS